MRDPGNIYYFAKVRYRLYLILSYQVRDPGNIYCKRKSKYRCFVISAPTTKLTSKRSEILYSNLRVTQPKTSQDARYPQQEPQQEPWLGHPRGKGRSTRMWSKAAVRRKDPTPATTQLPVAGHPTRTTASITFWTPCRLW